MGMLIAGDFGSGKSHLLEHFQHIALEENFVCSKVVISKETPLYDPAKVYRSAMQEARVPGKTGHALSEIAFSIKFDSPTFADFEKWVNSADRSLNSRFAATVYIFRYGEDIEVRDRIIRFWSGDPKAVAELKKWLKDMGEAASYKIDKISVKEMALQRYSFAPRLMVAAGYSGWVLLLDEVELIGRYSLRQRSRSYAELTRFMGKLEGVSLPGMTGVLTISGDFESVVLDPANDKGKKDREKIPAKLGGSGSESDSLLASQAERGMQLISDKDKLVLKPPSPETIHQTLTKLRAVYASAYGWQPPIEHIQLDTSTSTRMREHVKRCITEWDLKRLYPAYNPDIRVSEIKLDYSENPELESDTESDSKNEDTRDA